MSPIASLYLSNRRMPSMSLWTYTNRGLAGLHQDHSIALVVAVALLDVFLDLGEGTCRP